MLNLKRLIAGLFLLVVLVVTACSSPLSQNPPTSETVTYNDPFAYCTAVGTIDSPDARYTGAKIPDSIIAGMVAQGIVTADAPTEFKENAVWRCMDKAVWVCHFGANLPCLEKADTSKEHASEMTDYCRTNPDADSIPEYVTGRATVYEWKCNSGKPVAAQQIFEVDPQGYLANFWYKITPK